MLLSLKGLGRTFSSQCRDLPRKWLSFDEARKWARSLGLGTLSEWRTYPNRREDVPVNPHQTYGSQFRGYPDWLGYGGDGHCVSWVGRKIVASGQIKKHVSERSLSHSVHHAAWNVFTGHIKTCSGVSFVRLPPGCGAHTLFSSSQMQDCGRRMNGSVYYLLQHPRKLVPKVKFLYRGTTM